MLKALIVDDEAPARKRLTKLLGPMADAGRISVEAQAADGHEALAELEKGHFDLMFLDVQMPELTGFDVLERVPEDARPVIVFTTAFDEYAVKAFEANAIDYLLKPIDKKRLEDAVGRAERLTKKAGDRADDDERFNAMLDWLDEQADSPSSEQKSEEDYLKQLSVPYRDRLIIVPVDQIIAAEVRDGITRLVVADEKPSGTQKATEYIVSYTLEQLESRLDPEIFMRVHRSTIVRLSAIKEMVSWFSGRYKLILEGGTEVISSRERSKVLRKRMTI